MTEIITGVNLPAAQLQIAMGIPLQAIADVRKRYGQEPTDNSAIDFAVAQPLPPRGHVIAAFTAAALGTPRPHIQHCSILVE